MSLTVNIGLARTGLPNIPPAHALLALRRAGFAVHGRATVLASDTEPTVVAKVVDFYVRRSLPASFAAVAEELGQDCIAVFDDEGGLTGLYGPRAAAWGDFNPEFFLLPGGTRLSDHGTVLPA